MPRYTATFLTLTLATLSASFSHAQNAVSARPGTINYIEGQASLEGQQITPKSVGHAELAQGQYLATATGKAELLLTPGVFLRLDNNSTVKMVTPNLTHTEVQLTAGRATVEVDQLYKQNDILIDVGGGQTQLLKNGLYEFNAADSTVRVFKGEAAAFASLAPQPNEKAIKVKEGKQFAFSANTDTATGKTVGFDRKDAQNNDPLFKWSSLRSGYLGEANLDLAQSYAGDPGYSGASGWLWSPSIYSYTWMPGNGLFFSPFGYGFYSAPYLFGGGFIYGGGYGYGGYGYGGGYGGGYGYGGAYRGWRPGEGPRPGTARASSGAVRSAGSSSSGFHGSAASGGGGFRGGGGGGGGSHGGGGGGGHR